MQMEKCCMYGLMHRLIYISATKQWALNNGGLAPYWYDGDTQLVHFIGKDNIVFHCIIFPVMLKLHGNFTGKCTCQ